VREAKRNSSWNEPNCLYEEAAVNFVTSLLDIESEFYNRFKLFIEKVLHFGFVNSLAQVVLKCTCPGIPDFYQGTELWDLSFVDPDNRRPVDFNQREKLLSELNEFSDREKLIKQLWINRRDGQIKLWLTRILLGLRKHQPDFFRDAEYLELEVAGEYADFVFAFARRKNQRWPVVTFPIHSAELCKWQGRSDVLSIDWKDTRLKLPAEVNGDTDNMLLN
jgi:maltooligosyltrehalose synthase